MKRYLLFMWYYSDPGGGMNDFVDDFDTIEDARHYSIEWQRYEPKVSRGHIADTQDEFRLIEHYQDGKWL